MNLSNIYLVSSLLLLGSALSTRLGAEPTPLPYEGVLLRKLLFLRKGVCFFLTLGTPARETLLGPPRGKADF